MIRRCAAAVRGGALALAAGVALTTGLTLAPAAVAAPAPDIFKLPYSDELYQMTGTGDAVALEPLTYQEWESLGFPGFAVPPTAYVKVSWSPVLYGLSDFPGEALDLLPDPLSYEEWASVGFPTPVVEDALVAILKFETSDELFEATPAGELRKLSYPAWQAAGFPAPETLTGTGFAKLTWSPEIAFFLDLEAGEGLPITYEQWQAFDFPTPRSQQRFAGDTFAFESPDSPVIVYTGPTFTGPITEEQWNAAGSPTPDPAPTDPTPPTDPTDPAPPTDPTDPTPPPGEELPQEPGSGPQPVPGRGFVPVG